MKKNTIQFALALIGIVFSLAWFGSLLFVQIPEANKDIINTITGSLLTVCLGQIYNYYYGSSKSSQDKTDLMNGQGG